MTGQAGGGYTSAGRLDWRRGDSTPGPRVGGNGHAPQTGHPDQRRGAAVHPAWLRACDSVRRVRLGTTLGRGLADVTLNHLSDRREQW